MLRLDIIDQVVTDKDKVAEFKIAMKHAYNSMNENVNSIPKKILRKPKKGRNSKRQFITGNYQPCTKRSRIKKAKNVNLFSFLK